MEDLTNEAEPLATPTQVVAMRMRELRRARGWTAERLVEELAKHDVDWKPGVVTKLETGRRESVSVAELLGLADAFGVFPLVLLPGGEKWESMRKLVYGLLIDKAASGEVDYDSVSRGVSLALSLGLITVEDTEAILRVYEAMRPKRRAAYDALQQSFDDRT